MKKFLLSYEGFAAIVIVGVVLGAAVLLVCSYLTGGKATKRPEGDQ